MLCLHSEHTQIQLHSHSTYQHTEAWNTVNIKLLHVLWHKNEEAKVWSSLEIVLEYFILTSISQKRKEKNVQEMKYLESETQLQQKYYEQSL